MKIKILKLENGFWKATEDTVISEHSFTLFGNGKELRRFNCTPSDLEELAVGALFTMGKINSREEILSIRITPDKTAGYAEYASNKTKDYEELVSAQTTENVGFRTDRTASACPSGGVSAFGAGRRMCMPKKIPAEDISRMMEENLLPTPLFQETGGVHMVSLYSLTEEKLLFKMEDAARHNAVDKAVGAAVLQGLSMENTCLCVSGRISGEIMDKAVNAQIPMVLSKAAPTAQSAAKAENAGITLIGFIRNRRMNIYTHPWRIALPDEMYEETAAERRAETVRKSKNLTGGIDK